MYPIVFAVVSSFAFGCVIGLVLIMRRAGYLTFGGPGTPQLDEGAEPELSRPVVTGNTGRHLRLVGDEEERAA